jgi:predicted  nucleic acid-binding Zn-ribbon protein
MFYFKAQMERAEPKTAKEAEDLQRAKELFEGIYRGELYYLEQENKELKERLEKWEKDYKE